MGSPCIMTNILVVSYSVLGYYNSRHCQLESPKILLLGNDNSGPILCAETGNSLYSYSIHPMGRMFLPPLQTSL